MHRKVKMTTNDLVTDEAVDQNVAKLEANLARVEELTQRLLKVMGQGRQVAPSLKGPSQELYVKAATAYMSEMINNPAK
ncbi:MAG: polyhydroxyalkanoate synthase, partial [Yoonia sp.]